MSNTFATLLVCELELCVGHGDRDGCIGCLGEGDEGDGGPAGQGWGRQVGVFTPLGGVALDMLSQAPLGGPSHTFPLPVTTHKPFILTFWEWAAGINCGMSE